ncbi:hypothetical protein VTK26DRAFT_5161 [Humicola hyalothermophila]
MGTGRVLPTGLVEEKLQPKDEEEAAWPAEGSGNGPVAAVHYVKPSLIPLYARRYPRLIQGPADDVTSKSCWRADQQTPRLIINRVRAVARFVLSYLAFLVGTRLLLAALLDVHRGLENFQSLAIPVPGGDRQCSPSSDNNCGTSGGTSGRTGLTAIAMAKLSHFLAAVGLLVPLIQAVTLPLTASSRWILDANNQRVKFRCTNWAGHMETNVPEGLQHQHIDDIIDWVAQQGFNCVRLTYSIDHALNPAIRVSDSFVAAASAAGVSEDAMRELYDRVVSKNPWITLSTTTRDVFAAVVDGLWTRHGIMTILDNHVSKASWCCNLTDGNGWWDEAFGYNPWNSRFFKTQDWLAGLQAMAAWSQSHRGVVAMGLRNEIREFLLQNLNNRDDWYRFVKAGGDLVHATHPDLLILVGGTQSTTDLVHLRANDGARMLDTTFPAPSGSGTADWRHKLVWEMHAYSFTVTFADPFKSCDLVQAQYGLFSGFVLEQGKPYTAPLILSEFGVGMRNGGLDNGLNEQDDRYLRCLVDYMTNNDADWAVWALQGSYYVRDQTVDLDEGWGLMNHDWSGWRNEGFKDMLGDMWKMTQGP